MAVQQQIQEFMHDLVEINLRTLDRLADLQARDLHEFVKANGEYWNKALDISAPGDVLKNQNSLNRSLWDLAREDVKERSDILSSAIDQTGKVLRNTWTRRDAQSPVQPEVQDVNLEQPPAAEHPMAAG